MTTETLEPNKPKKVVVLLHGFAAHWLLMTRLQKHFEAAGYATVNWGYKSWFKPIDEHAIKLHQRIMELDADPSVSSIDFVTHSMGCIVARAALLKGKPAKLGRWVMLAPPNQGSQVANVCPQLIKRMLKPINELQAKQDSYVNQLAHPSGIDVAIVQATGDYIVSEPLTRMPNNQEKARLVVSGLHSQILFRDEVATESMYFLQHGQFSTTEEAN